MTETWMIFPVIQVIMAAIAGALAGIYGETVTSHLGGGVIEKIVNLTVVLSFLLVAYTVLGLWAYFTGSDMGHAIKGTIILLMSAVLMLMGYYLKKFSDGTKVMESGE